METYSSDKAQRSASASAGITTRYLALLIGLLLAFYLIGTFTKRFDRDEWQTMVAAAGVADGASLYTDIWDNHGPLLSLVLGGGIRLLDTQDHAVLMFGGRLLMLAMLMVTLWLTGRLARCACPSSPLAGPLAMMVLLCSQTFFAKGLEIRPDVPLLLVWTLCLLLLFRGMKEDRGCLFLWAGVALGFGFTFSLKTLLLGAACGLAMLVVMVRRRHFSPTWLLAFGAGVVPAPLAMVPGLYAQGNLRAFLDSYLGQNFDRVAESWLTGLSKAWQAEELLLLALAAATIFALRYRRHTTLPEGITVLLTVSAATLVLYLRLPTHYKQSLLPLLPAASVVIAWAIGQLPPTARLWGRHIPLNLVLLLAVVVSTLDHEWFRYKSAGDLRIASDRQALMAREALVFEGVGLPLFQPRPFIYKSFVNTLCSRIREGQLNIDIPAELDRKDVPYAGLDGRLASMGSEVESFILTNYLPLNAGELLAAGFVLSADPGNKVDFTVRISGRYFVKGEAGVSELRVDGQPAGETVELNDGPHSFAWSGESPLILSIAPPQQWSAAADTLLTWKHQRLAALIP